MEEKAEHVCPQEESFGRGIAGGKALSVVHGEEVKDVSQICGEHLLLAFEGLTTYCGILDHCITVKPSKSRNVVFE